MIRGTYYNQRVRLHKNNKRTQVLAAHFEHPGCSKPNTVLVQITPYTKAWVPMTEVDDVTKWRGFRPKHVCRHLKDMGMDDCTKPISNAYDSWVYNKELTLAASCAALSPHLRTHDAWKKGEQPTDGE